MKVLFAVNSNGLGHATRMTPLIAESLRRRHEVYIISNYRALDFLKNEFKDKVKNYFLLPDYSLQKRTFTEKSVSVSRFLMYLPLYLNEFRQEHVRFLRIHKKYKFERIITDTRFGIYSTEVPSYLICHHIKMSLNEFLKSSNRITEFAFYAIKNKFKKILIPDFEKDSLAGEYTHNFKYLTKSDVKYLGLLSMVKKQKVNEDIDYFFSISGPEPQRTVFEKKIISSISKLKNKKIVVALGKPESKTVKKMQNLIIYSFLNRDMQTDIMNSSKLIITRSGYTTLMDLAELGKKALLIPTKGQPEQEYLAKYHLKQGNFYYKEMDDLNLPKDLEIAMNFPGFICKKKTKDSVKIFMNQVF